MTRGLPADVLVPRQVYESLVASNSARSEATEQDGRKWSCGEKNEAFQERKRAYE